MEIPIGESEFNRCFQKWLDGELIQNAFPMLNADQREFIMTGITPKEWDSMICGNTK
jgi:hypothetical protein